MTDNQTLKAPPRRNLAFCWLAASIVTGLAATFMSAQFVAAALQSAGAAIPASDRLFMAGQDIIGFAPLYTVFIAIGLAIAFTVAGLLARRFAARRVLIFTVAGAVSMAVMLLAMERVFFGVPLVAGARTGLGFAAQMLCGALGGYVFARLRTPKPARERQSPDDILPAQ